MKWQLPAPAGPGASRWCACGFPGRGGRSAAILTLIACLVGPAAASPAFARFGFNDVVAKAEALARRPFEDPRGQVPHWLLEISYDQWRDIRFRPERALWRQERLPFTVQFFHPGLFYDRPVTVNIVGSTGTSTVEFSPSDFDYGQTQLGSRVPQDLGFAGFRLHYPIKTPAYQDEVIVFLGASYFRAVGKEQGFGASARGIAIDTASSTGEEFPYFREFWILRPSANAADIQVFALLDSPSLTGAYRFVVQPGAETIVDVEGRLSFRRAVTKLGIAPLTSMFFYGENTTRSIADFRPEVHDSDGLLLAASSGEWIWRPLDNPESLRVSGFRMTDPVGFGLLQRDRDFDHHQDLETRPDRRPSIWVAPKEPWGPGRVELVEIPTHADTNDNVVAYWVPDVLPPPDKPLAFSYRMHWFDDHGMRPPGGRTLATRTEPGTGERARRFVVDFTGKDLNKVPTDSVLRGVITIGSNTDGSGGLLEQQVLKNPVTGGWRLVFQVRPEDDRPLELRAFLQQKDRALTETWSYVMGQ